MKLTEDEREALEHALGNCSAGDESKAALPTTRRRRVIIDELYYKVRIATEVTIS